VGNFSVYSGQHTFIVSDINSCTTSINVDIPMPPALIAEINNVNDVDCYGGNNGKISINITSGNSPYRLDWHNSFEIFTTNNFLKEGFKAGNYEFKLTDNNGCLLTKEITITEPAKIEIFINVQGPSCIGNNNGYIELSVNGGTAPYSYLWDFIPSNDSILSGLQAGHYSVIIKDAYNCVAEFSGISLKDFPELCLKIPNALTPNGDGINDLWIIENIELFPDAIAWIYNRWGQEVYYDNPYRNPWDGFYKGKILPSGTYLYIIQTNRGLGSVYKGTVTIIY
jgi:gliding motility-associated-like protein